MRIKKAVLIEEGDKILILKGTQTFLVDSIEWVEDEVLGRVLAFSSASSNIRMLVEPEQDVEIDAPEFLTRQQIFDKVVAHLMKQQMAAIENGECRYRTESGLMCAIGCLIPDSAYLECFEGTTVDVSPPGPLYDGFRQMMLYSGLDFDDSNTLQLLNSLQRLHDSWMPRSMSPEALTGPLKAIADNNNLQWNFK